jgi:arsenate reductase
MTELTQPREFNVFFLCTGNSARSIMAECALNRWGAGRLRGFSAGSHPKGEIHPETRALLVELGYDTAGLRSKSWEEFERADSPPMDLIITVCDQAAGEVCPLWPGRPLTVHWGVSDPAAFVGSDEERRFHFRRIYAQLESRIRTLVNSANVSDPMMLRQRASQIGEQMT